MNRLEILETIAQHLNLDEAQFECLDPFMSTIQAFKLAVDFELDLCLTAHCTKVSKDGCLLTECYNRDAYSAARESVVLAVYKLIKDMQ